MFGGGVRSAAPLVIAVALAVCGFRDDADGTGGAGSTTRAGTGTTDVGETPGDDGSSDRGDGTTVDQDDDGPGDDGATDCAGVTCSDHGTCEISLSGPVCVCDRGYHPDELSCVVERGEWKLPDGHWVPAKMPPVIVFPRPDTETPAWARHRKGYPGLAYRIPIAVQGGAWPFKYELVSMPAGMTVGTTPDTPSYGVVEWLDPVEGTHPIELRVTDQDLTEATVTWDLVVDTERTLFLDPVVGDDQNPGSPSEPKQTFAGWHLDDTNDATYAGYHVILRGGDYPWAGMPSQNGNIQIHQDKPLVFLAFPGESPVLDMSGGKFIANPGHAADLFVGGLRFEHADPTRPNAHFFWLTGSGTQRVTMFENAFFDLGPGTVGNDNPSASFVSDTTTRKSYFAYVGNTYDTFAFADNGVSMFDHYYTDYTVFEGNRLSNMQGQYGGWSKSHNDLVTYRRNTGQYDGTRAFVFGTYPDLPDARVEFCWNFLSTEDTSSTSSALIWFDHTVEGLANAWAYRNTVVGRIHARTPPTAAYVRLAERNVVVSDSDEPIADFVDEENLVGGTADGLIDDEGRLQGASMVEHLGTHGWEIQ